MLLLVVLASAGCDPFHTELAESTPRVYEAAEPTAAEAPTSLVVMDWNVKFGGARIDFFFDCFGDRVLMTRDEVVTNLEALAAKIREVNPDVLLLQEVDVNSKRTAFVDQLQWLLDHTELNHGVYASHWQADFIPSDGLGAMDNGSAILSRWPIAQAERHALPLRTDQSSLTRYFYLRRNVLSARLELPAGSAAGRDVWVVNVHTDAYGEDGTKQRHIDGFSDVMNALDDAGAEPGEDVDGWVGTLDAPLLGGFLRLLRALEDPIERKLVAPLVQRELIVRLLCSDHAGALRRMTQTDDGRIRRAMAFIREHASEGISVEQIAKSVAMSPSHFAHRFRAVARVSPIRYAKQVRLQQARLLLVRDGVSVSEAAERVGYLNPSQFTREFKATFGTTPLKYTKRFALAAP